MTTRHVPISEETYDVLRGIEGRAALGFKGCLNFEERRAIKAVVQAYGAAPVEAREESQREESHA